MEKLGPKKKAQIKKAQDFARGQDPPKVDAGSANSSQTNKEKLKSAFVAYATKSNTSIQSGVFQIGDTSIVPKYELHASVILDSGSNCHVGNDESRFTGLTPPALGQEDCIYAGDTIIPIRGYGTMTVTVQTRGYPNGRVITVSNAAYVPTFHTSIVSLKLLNKHGIYWENRTNQLV